VKVVNGFGLTAKKASNLVELNQLISEPIKGLSVVALRIKQNEKISAKEKSYMLNEVSNKEKQILISLMRPRNQGNDE